MMDQAFLRKMLKYQQENDVKGQCMTHVLLYCDYLKLSHIPCKPISGILAYYDEENEANVLVCHCWCDVQGRIIEPSYEYSSVPYKKTYYASLQKFFEELGQYDNVKTRKRYFIEIVSWFDTQLRRSMSNAKMAPAYYKEICRGMKLL